MTMKQHQHPCSGPQMESTNYWMCILNFPSTCGLAIRQWLFLQANHMNCEYSNPGTKLGIQSKEFSWLIDGFNQRFSFVCGTDYANLVKLLLIWLHQILIKQQSQTIWRFNKDSGSDTSGTYTKILDYMFFTHPNPILILNQIFLIYQLIIKN